MATVVRLPDSMQRQWRVMERQLVPLFASCDFTLGETEHVLATLKPLFVRHCGEMNFSFDGLAPDEAVQKLNQWLTASWLGLLVEVAAREALLLRCGEVTP
jgi:hypothetical protein